MQQHDVTLCLCGMCSMYVTYALNSQFMLLMTRARKARELLIVDTMFSWVSVLEITDFRQYD